MILQRFLRDRGASVVPLFALSVIPLTGLVGAAIDYSRASAARTAMQSALDSTVLAVSKSAGTLAAAQVQANATSYFNAIYTRTEVQNVAVTASYTNTQGSQLVVSANGTIPTAFMGLMGFSSLPVAATATAVWGNTRLRVALVLDNTGSMKNDGKIDALKTATHNLLDQLKSASQTDGDVYVAIVPFAKDVNVGAANYSQSWIDWTAWEAAPANSTPAATTGPGSSCPYSTYSNGFTCTTGPATGSSTTSTIPSSGTYKGYICPGVDNGRVSSTRLGNYYNGCYTSTKYSCTGSSCSCTGHSNCTCSGSGSAKTCQTNSGYWEHAWVANEHSTWTGCVWDRDQNYDVQNTTPSAGTLFPAQQYQYCNQALTQLSYDWVGLNAAVDAMSPAGSTNQTIGLAWGWQALTQTPPLNAPAFDSRYTYKQVIILLSDGLNTQDRWYGDGSNTSTQVDTRMQLACSNFKAADPDRNELYTVQVNTGGDPTSTLLRDCASNKTGTYDHFFELKSADQIITTFQAIGTKMSQLRLSK